MDGALQATDVVIVGAGPIGLELAVVLKRMGVDYVHLEAGQIGQTINGYPRQARFFSSPERIAIAGVPLFTPDQAKATREEYLVYLRAVVQQYDLAVRTYERVTSIRRDPQNAWFLLRSVRGGVERTISARCVVLAIGDMHHPRMLHIPGEDLPHVSHYFEDPHPFFRQKLLIVGGRNSAVEAALRCQRAGAEVAISYRRGEFDRQSIKYWLMPELDSLIKAGKITFLPHTAPTAITPEHVTLASTSGELGQRRVEADFVLLLTGYVQDTTLFEQAGVTLVGENRAPQVDPQTMQTNVPGLYVAGTAAAGTQVRFRLFIENCHPHVARIAQAITGREPDPTLINPAAGEFQLPES
jgi:thioredoxin reductase (NADPH)